jgi:hypothetical protein
MSQGGEGGVWKKERFELEIKSPIYNFKDTQFRKIEIDAYAQN